MSNRWLLYASRFNPSCRDAMGLFSRSLDRPLSRADRIIFGIHLLHCPACRRSRRQISLLVFTLRRLSGIQAGGGPRAFPGLPIEVRERIKRSLRQQ